MVDIILGAVCEYDYPKVSSWIRSLRATPYSGEVVVLHRGLDNYTLNKLASYGCKFFEIKSQERWPLARLAASIDYLKTREDIRHVFFTDTKDLVFQCDISVWASYYFMAHDCSIVGASEGEFYSDQEWGRENMIECFGQQAFERVKYKTIMNMGCMAGDAWDFLDLLEEWYPLAASTHVKVSDQAALNLLRLDHPEINLASPEDGLSVVCGSFLIPEHQNILREPVPRVDQNGTIYTPNGVKYTTVHMYDRVPGLNQVIWNKYWEV